MLFNCSSLRYLETHIEAIFDRVGGPAYKKTYPLGTKDLPVVGQAYEESDVKPPEPPVLQPPEEIVLSEPPGY